MAGMIRGSHSNRQQRVMLDEAIGPKIYDTCRPNNPNIPFFASCRAYGERILPELPAEAAPDRSWPCLVEPGPCSIEAYEAILEKSARCRGGRCRRRCRPCRPLTMYICQSGVVQLQLARRPYAPASAAQDHRLREERDICFTLVSPTEYTYIREWLGARGLHIVQIPKLATPFGLAYKALWRGHVGVLHNICRELGLDRDDFEFSRSKLPPGVIPMGGTPYWEWELPGADGIARDGRATDDCGIQRIEWALQRDA